MAARRVRDEVGCADEKFDIDQAYEHYGILWVATDLPKKMHAVVAPEKKVVLVSRRLEVAARRFYLCHELIEVIYPTTLYHGSFFNEVAGHVLVPPWILSPEKHGTIRAIMECFEVPFAVAMFQCNLLV